MLPSSKRRPEPSQTDMVYTGEIEVVRERFSRPSRPVVDRRPISYPAFVAPRAEAREEADSSTRIAIAKPRSGRISRATEARHATIVPPSSPSLEAFPRDLSESDDEMTRLMSYRPRLTAATAPSRRPATWTTPPAPASTPASTPRVSSKSLDPDTRLAMTMPSRKRAREATLAHGERGPDTLRPVAIPLVEQAADTSGRHEMQPTSVTMSTRVLPGRPTMTWAAALVVLGVFAGLGTSLFARGDVSQAASGPRFAPETAVRPPRVDNAAEPVAPGLPAGIAAAPVLAPVPSVAATNVDRAAGRAERRDGDPASDALAALTDVKGRDDSVHLVTPRPTYVAPSYTAPARRWTTATKRVASAPVQASAPVESSLSSPLAALPTPKPATKSRASRGDADMQAASASDALARAQLEAALR